MSIPGSASPLFFTAAADAAAFTLEKSVRFNDGDTPYLNRTPSSTGNQRTFTFACWAKRSELAAYPVIFSAGPNTQTTGYFELSFQINPLTVLIKNVATFTVDGVHRDTAGWYHIVVEVDTTAASNSDRFKLYLNGVQQTFTTSPTITQNTDLQVNAAVVHNIGVGKSSSGANASYFDGYLADVYLIDGQALDATSFGAFDDNGVWQAAAYSGSFGTNGFHLFDFANESGIGNDSSGNDNDFTANNLTSEGGSKIRTTELSVNHASGVISLPGNAFDSTYISARINTSTFAVTNTAWLGSYANGYAEARWIPVGGYAVTSSLRVYFGVYSNAAASSTLTVTYTDTTTESSSQFTSGNNNWMTLFTASNAAGKTIQKIEISNPSTTNVQFGGFVIDDEIVETANTGTDVLRDVPTNGDSSDDTGAGGEVSGNYCTWNPLVKPYAGAFVFKNGNMEAHNAASTYGVVMGTIPMSSGKWYWEVTVNGTPNNSYDYIGIVASDSGPAYPTLTTTMPNQLWYLAGGTKIDGSTSSSYGATYGDGDVIGVALDLDSSTTTLTFYKNGVSQGTAFSNLASGKSWVSAVGDYSNALTTTSWNANWGQRAFAYSAPSGYKPLCTTLLPTLTIANGRDHFDTKLYTGNGGSSTITVSGYNFAPNLVWLKGRSDPDKHGLYDTVRGATKLLKPSSNAAETTQNGVTAFNSDGFDIGDYAETNGNNRTYVAWAWNIPGSASSNSDGTITSSVTKNADAGISLVTWTGTGSAGTVGHGLGSKPDLIITKVYGDSSYADNWPVYSSVFDGTHYAYLNDTRKFTDYSDFWNDGTATSTVFPVGSDNSDNTKSLLALCFTSVAGFSSIGSYVGNGSSDGTFVFTNFRPAWVLIKRTDTSSSWVLFDSARSPFNDVNEWLRPNGDDAEATSNNIDFLSNGFKLRKNDSFTNQSGKTFIYAAFSENAFSLNGGLAR